MPGKFADLGTHLDLLEEGDHLGLAESGFLHAETPAGGIPYLRVTPVFEVSSDCAWQAIKQKRKNPCKSMTCKGLSVLAERVGKPRIHQSPEEKPRTHSAVLHGQVHELMMAGW